MMMMKMGFRDAEIQKFRDPEIPRSRDPEIPRYLDPEIPRSWDPEIPRSRDLEIPRSRNNENKYKSNRSILENSSWWKYMYFNTNVPQTFRLPKPMNFKWIPEIQTSRDLEVPRSKQKLAVWCFCSTFPQHVWQHSGLAKRDWKTETHSHKTMFLQQNHSTFAYAEEQ